MGRGNQKKGSGNVRGELFRLKMRDARYRLLIKYKLRGGDTVKMELDSMKARLDDFLHEVEEEVPKLVESLVLDYGAGLDLSEDSEPIKQLRNWVFEFCEGPWLLSQPGDQRRVFASGMSLYDMQVAEVGGIGARVRASVLEEAAKAKNQAMPEANQDSAAADIAEEEYVFRKEGNVWRIRFAGKQIFLKDCKGLRYIQELLRHPNDEISVLDLVSLTSLPPAITQGMSANSQDDDEDEGDHARSAKSRAKGIEELRRARKELKQAKALPDSDPSKRLQVDEAQDEVRTLLDELGLRRDPYPKQRKAVGACIDRAMKKIKEEHNPLWKHLDRSFERGTSCAYYPEDRPPDWVL